MTERYARDPDPGLLDRVAAWLFPSLSLDPPEGRGPCIGGCVDHDHQAARPEPEPEAEL